jgi:hypothetical protein
MSTEPLFFETKNSVYKETRNGTEDYSSKFSAG